MLGLGKKKKYVIRFVKIEDVNKPDMFYTTINGKMVDHSMKINYEEALQIYNNILKRNVFDKRNIILKEKNIEI